jgi:hypothetical protein
VVKAFEAITEREGYGVVKRGSEGGCYYKEEKENQVHECSNIRE